MTYHMLYKQLFMLVYLELQISWYYYYITCWCLNIAPSSHFCGAFDIISVKGTRWCKRTIFLFPPVLPYSSSNAALQPNAQHIHTLSNQHSWIKYHPFKGNTRCCCFVNYSLTPSTSPLSFIVYLKIPVASWLLHMISPSTTHHTL